MNCKYVLDTLYFTDLLVFFSEKLGNYYEGGGNGFHTELA